MPHPIPAVNGDSSGTAVADLEEQSLTMLAAPAGEGRSEEAVVKQSASPHRPATGDSPSGRTSPGNSELREGHPSVSKLRRVAVKLERNRSHRDFLETCEKERLIPRGFRLKWTCHFDEEDEQVKNILERSSRELIGICAGLAHNKVPDLKSSTGYYFKRSRGTREGRS